MSPTEEHVIVIDNLVSVLGGGEDSSRSTTVGSGGRRNVVQNSVTSSSSSSGQRHRHRWNGHPRRQRVLPTDNRSVDTTLLASSVGTVVGPTRDAFVRCVVFYDDTIENDVSRQFDISFVDGGMAVQAEHTENAVVPGKQKKKKKLLLSSLRRTSNQSVTVRSLSPQLQSVCKLQVGDVVTKVNQKTIGPSYNAARVAQLWQKSIPSTHGTIRSIQTGNDAGLDTLLQVTIIKPHPDATCQDLGLGVWWWCGLCVRFVERDTLASATPLKTDDVLESVNDILLEDLRNPEDFEAIVKALPMEVTLVIKRGKPRWNGQFN